MVSIWANVYARLTRKARKRAKQEKFAQEEIAGVQQFKLGQQVAGDLRQAIGLNPVYESNHAVYKNIGPMWVLERPVTGLGYMSSVYVPNSHVHTGAQAHLVCSISVDVSHNLIHVLWTPFPNYRGDEEEFSLDQLEDVLNKARAHIRDWRLFPEESILPPHRTRIVRSMSC